MSKTTITRKDIMDITEYGKTRKTHRAQIMKMKKNRRLHCGPYATFYFENFDTMWYQVHEMLFIEKGGEEQIKDELDAYNPLIPNGEELVSTLMFEIANPELRAKFLDGLGGIEDSTFFNIDGMVVKGVPEADADRTNAEGKASSVQFLHFPFTPDQVTAFKRPNARVELSIEHSKYAHTSLLPEISRKVLEIDFT
ncbi:MAG: hypothetical protein CMF69_01545 [Magnetovibrio sp.]|nr:hypothetical protein [Magnetovibrio sp.]